MALWLELIPKLHKSDRLDARYHQLDEWDNLTSFEAEGTRHTALRDLLTTTSTVRSPSLSQQASGASKTRSSLTTTTTTTTTTTFTTTGGGSGAESSSSLSGSTFVRQQQPADEALSADVNTVSLGITIAVGSFLLFINILVFVAVYYQKDRIRRERRRHKADLHAATSSQQLQCRHDDVDGIVAQTDSLSSDVRSNLSLPYGYTSTDLVDFQPATAAATSTKNHHHHHHQAGVTLPRLSSPPGVIDAPAYGTVRSRAVPRWSTTSDQLEMTPTTTTGDYSECVGHNGGLVQKWPAVSGAAALGAALYQSSTDFSNPLMTSGAGVLTLHDSRKPSTVV